MPFGRILKFTPCRVNLPIATQGKGHLSIYRGPYAEKHYIFSLSCSWLGFQINLIWFFKGMCCILWKETGILNSYILYCTMGLLKSTQVPKLGCADCDWEACPSLFLHRVEKDRGNFMWNSLMCILLCARVISSSTEKFSSVFNTIGTGFHMCLSLPVLW